MLENYWGGKKFFLYYMVCGIGAGLINELVMYLQIAFAETPGLVEAAINRVPTVGASGAIYGLLLAYGMMFPNNVLQFIFPPIALKAKWMVIIFGAIELISGLSGRGGNVAHLYHHDTVLEEKEPAVLLACPASYDPARIQKEAQSFPEPVLPAGGDSMLHTAAAQLRVGADAQLCVGADRPGNLPSCGIFRPVFHPHAGGQCAAAGPGPAEVVLLGWSSSAWIPVIALLPSLFFVGFFFRAGDRNALPESVVARADGLKVLTWNVGGFRSGVSDEVEDNIRGVTALVASESPDVVSLQEFRTGDPSGLRRMFPGYPHVREHFFQLRNGDYVGNVTFSRLPLRGDGHLPFRGTTNMVLMWNMPGRSSGCTTCIWSRTISR